MDIILLRSLSKMYPYSLFLHVHLLQTLLSESNVLDKGVLTLVLVLSYSFMFLVTALWRGKEW